MSTNIDFLFAMATREKYRYPYKGYVSTEDLWDLSPQALDFIYKELNAQLKKLTNEDSLLQTEEAPVTTLKNRIEIVKYITQEKLAEIEDRKKAASNAAKRQQIMEILAVKENQELNNMSAEDLRKMLAELQ